MQTPSPSITDPLIIRMFILYDARAKRAPFEGFKAFCEAIGNESFDYAEYEYWYYRFVAGSLDFNDERSAVEKPLTLDELPNEMIGEILGKLDWSNRLTTRKVSQKLRHLSDQSAELKKITVEIGYSDVKLKLGKHTLIYSDGKLTHNTSEKEKKFQISKNYVDVAISDLSIILNLPKLKIEKFNYHEKTQENFIERLLQKIPEDSRKIHVNWTIIRTKKAEDGVKLLSRLKPGILENVSIVCGEDLRNIKELLETEQFKQATTIDVNAFASLDPSEIPKFLKFNDFKLSVESITAQDVIALRDALAGGHAHFQECKVYCRGGVDLLQMKRALGAESRRMYGMEMIRQRHPIENSTESLIVRAVSQEIRVSRQFPDGYGYSEETSWFRDFDEMMAMELFDPDD